MRYDSFKGCIPKIDPALLPQGYGAFAQNVDIKSGTLKAIKNPIAVKALEAETSTCYWHVDQWREFHGDVDVVPSMAVDGSGRIYITGDGSPKQTTAAIMEAGANPVNLGLSSPSSPLSTALTGSSSGGEVQRAVAYTYTRVNRFGEESPPAPETAVIDVMEGQGVILTGFALPTDASEDIVAYRIYRTGDAGYFWIHFPNTPDETPYHTGDLPSTYSSFTDWSSTDRDVLLESFSSLVTGSASLGREWEPPPVDMIGICSHAAGGWAGFRGNEVCISEPLAAYAWPRAYRKTLDTDIVGIAPFNDILIVLTRTHPYLVYGALPEIMVQQKTPHPQSCIAKKTIAVTPIGVLFGSPDGLCLCTASSCLILTNNLLTAKQWQAWHPENFLCLYHDEKCWLFSLESDGPRMGKGMVFDLQGGDGLVFLDVGARIVGGLSHPESDALLLILDRGGVRTLERWGGGSESLSAQWTSPSIKQQKPCNVACGAVLHTGEMVVDVIADGETQQIINPGEESFWLDAGFLARHWSFSMVFTGGVQRARFGFSKESLR